MGWPTVAVLLLVHGLLSYSAAMTKCVAGDEPVHIVAGLSFWTMDHFYFNPENGQLPQRWAGWPLALAGYRLPAITTWDDVDQQNQMIFSFLYGDDRVSGNAELILMLARLPMIVAGMMIGLIIWYWTRRLFGWAGGLVSLCLFVFCPNFLAHNPLVTSDAFAVLFFLAALGALWLLFHEVTWLKLIMATGAVAGLCLSKMSAPLLGPVVLLMLMVRVIAGQPLPVNWGVGRRLITSRWSMSALFTVLLIIIGLLTWVIIWAAFGFRFNASNTIDAHGLSFDLWGPMVQTTQRDMTWLVWLRDHRLLPEAYLYGYAHVFRWSQERNAFFMGEFSLTGWFWFFPVAFLIKTPIATLLTLLLALVAGVLHFFDRQSRWRPSWWPRLRRGLYRTLPLWAFLIVYWSALLSSNLNLGVRHVLPATAALFVLAGAAGYWLLHAQRIIRIGMWALLGVLAVEVALFWPNYLAYFNQLIGGPTQGHKYLVDSSLDWGQDMPALKRWLEKQGLNTNQASEPVYLAYFGGGSPRYYDLKIIALPSFGAMHYETGHPLPTLKPGVYCISATIFQGITLNRAPGNQWLPVYEAMYRDLRRLIDEFGNTPVGSAERRALLDRDGEREWVIRVEFFGQLRLQRLLTYLRYRDEQGRYVREPDDMINYSILVYRLSQEELDAVFTLTP